MMGNLRGMINSVEGQTQQFRDQVRKLPKFTSRVKDVSEGSIATTTVGKIQDILNEEVNLMFNVMVIGDYIDDKDYMWLPKGYNPDDYLTCVPEREEVHLIDDVKDSAKGNGAHGHIVNVFSEFSE